MGAWWTFMQDNTLCEDDNYYTAIPRNTSDIAVYNSK